MSTPDNFYLKVTAGSAYDSHTPVNVNSSKPLVIETSTATVYLVVSIKDFRGPPSSGKKAPSTGPYFDDNSRKGTRYSIAFRVIPKRKISGDALVIGNDFDQPITQYLPPFFGTALGVVKRFLDPGIDGDPYAEKPHLYGPVLSSINVLGIGQTNDEKDFGNQVVKEEIKGDQAKKTWKDDKIPTESLARSKYFLSKENRKKFEFEPGWCYDFDFYNGYLDFNDFTLKLPMGISFNLLRQLKTTDIPPLRYVLRDRDADEPLFHVTLKLCTIESETEPTDTPQEPEESEVD